MPDQALTQTAPAPHGELPIETGGKALADADAAMILIHGRGASAQSILTLAEVLKEPNFTYLAPQAAQHSWYPHSFLAPIQANEPGISSGLAIIDRLVAEIEAAGIPNERVVLGGFSQGACLAAEYVARHARRYGGLLVFSGGLIGPPGTPRAYAGSLESTPIFIGCSNADTHIPLERVHETTQVLSQLGGDVTERIYPGMDHTIIQDEIDAAMEIVTAVGATR